MSHTKAVPMETDGPWGSVSRSIALIRRVRPVCLVARILLIGLLAIGISGIGHVVAHPAREESRDLAELVTHLADGIHQPVPLPNEISSSLGYEPVAADGKLTKPSGSCSTPIPVGPDAFEEACRTHDLGYDLLRSAEENGHRLGVWARFGLDRRLYLDLLSTCETLRCRTAAATYFTAVTTNSIRQGYGAPTDEPATPWVGVGLLVVCFALLSDPRVGLRAKARLLTGGTPMPFTGGRDRPGSKPSKKPERRSVRTVTRGLSPIIDEVETFARPRIWRLRSHGRSTV